MKVTIDKKGNEAVIKIKGRLDTNTSRECEEEIMSVWDTPMDTICVDCSELEYVSSAGLRLFLVMQKTASARKSHLRLVGMREEVRDTFTMTGFNAIFTIEDARK